MSWRTFIRQRAFAAVLGLIDGILTALTLASGRIIQADNRPTLSLALRVAIASALSGGIVFFAAELARRNYELIHAERELSLVSRGYLATTRLGHFVLLETFQTTLVVVLSNFVGALAPLLAGPMFRQFAWMPICFAIVSLGILGILIAQVTHRGRIRWAVSLMIVGTAVAGLGIWLHIV